MLRIGLRGKVVASTGLIISAMFAATTWRNVNSTRDLLLDGMLARAEALGSRLQAPVEEFLGAGSPLGMLASLGLAAEARAMVEGSNGELVSAALLDAGGTIQLHNETSRIGEVESDQAVAQAVGKLSGGAHVVKGAQGSEVVVLVPVRAPDGTTAAAVRLGFSRAQIDAALRQEITTLLGLLLLSLLVTFITLAALVTRTVIKPLRTIGQAARAIASGRLRERVPVAAADEIGDLGRSFNDMAGQLEAVLLEVRQASSAVEGASTQVATSQGKVRSGAEEQQESVDRTAGAVTELDRAAATIQERVEALSLSAQSASSSSLEVAATAEEVTAHVDELAKSVDVTSSGIAEIAASLKQVAGTVDQLARATDTVAASVTQMDASIAQIERIAEETARLSTTVAEDADGGQAAVQATVEGMERIRAATQMVSGVMRGFEGTAAEIGRILQIIDDVADQTNLLALNASIIAAQAGEHGRGFAVVAEEIKALAERTAASTREIAALISKVQEGSRAAVSAMDEGEQAVVDGVERSRRAGAALAQILESARRAQEMASRIAKATQEHSSGSREVTASVGQISEMTRQLRQAAEEQSRGAAEVARAAAAMTEASRLVRRSAHEQRDASKVIGSTMEQVAESTRSIAQATQQQTQETREIVEAMEAIRAIAETTTATTVDMDEVVGSLKEAASRLSESLSRFEVAA